MTRHIKENHASDFYDSILVLLPTIAGLGGNPIQCGLCIANNGVANCVDFVAIRILNSGEEEVRDVLVARCNQEIDTSNMEVLTTFKGKRCKYYTIVAEESLFLWYMCINRKKMCLKSRCRLI